MINLLLPDLPEELSNDVQLLINNLLTLFERAYNLRSPGKTDPLETVKTATKKWTLNRGIDIQQLEEMRARNSVIISMDPEEIQQRIRQEHPESLPKS